MPDDITQTEAPQADAAAEQDTQAAVSEQPTAESTITPEDSANQVAPEAPIAPIVSAKPTAEEVQAAAEQAGIAATGIHHLNAIMNPKMMIGNAVSRIILEAKRTTAWIEADVKKLIEAAEAAL